MYSSSSEPETVRGMLARSLLALREGIPQQYEKICEAMHGLSVLLFVDREAFEATSDGLQVVLAAIPSCATPASGAVELATRTETIEALIDGKLDLIDAVIDDGVALRGSVPHLLKFYDALIAYLHGAVRSPTSQNILREFRSLAQKRNPPRGTTHGLK